MLGDIGVSGWSCVEYWEVVDGVGEQRRRELLRKD